MGQGQKKIEFFEMKVFDFARKAGREHLPWRRDGISAYEVWVSEIMLQQTQVSRVLSYYEKFLIRFPNIETLAFVSWEEFLPFYSGLGYYARGRNMLRTAKSIVEKFGGKFPKDIRELETLPGIGKYTSAAIMSFAYGANIIAWDTNVRRVIGRFFLGTKQADFSEMEKIGKKFSCRAKELNASLMDFGSAICAGKPKCGACPLLTKCRYKREGGKQELGTRNNKHLTIGTRIKNEELRMRNGVRELITDNSQIATGNEQRKIKLFLGRGSVWKEARVEVTLHENHKKYFSSVKKSYQPFSIPPSHNTRAGIKIWFRERYGLEVSVRPPHGKIIHKDVPTILVNVQILTGKHVFTEFPREHLFGRNVRV